MKTNGTEKPVETAEIMDQTAGIVSAYVSRNSLPMTELPRLISEVHKSLISLEGHEAGEDRPDPAVPVRKSITPDFLVCLEDGKKLKMLKRYLKTSFDMTPAEYRDRWNLPADYPMVAPNYAKKRSELAKQIGLGTRGNKHM